MFGCPKRMKTQSLELMLWCWMKENNYIVDLANQTLWKGEAVGACVVIPDRNAVATVKRFACMWFAFAFGYKKQTLMWHEAVLVRHKHDCGRVTNMEVHVLYKALAAHDRINIPGKQKLKMSQVIESLQSEGILSRCVSTVNSPVWPVRKPDNYGDELLITDRLTLLCLLQLLWYPEPWHSG